MRGKKYLWTLFILMFLASMARISIPATASPTVTFKIDPAITTGVTVGGEVAVNVSIEADPGAAIIGWGIDIKVDPDVLKPGYYWDPPGPPPPEWKVIKTGVAGYFLYDWCYANNWQMPTPTEILVGTRNETAGTIIDYTETIKAWTFLDVGNGTDGTGTLVTFYFTSLNQTAWSPIEMTVALYYTTWQGDLGDERVPDLIINGHYNVPAHDVAVTDVSAPTNATVGDSVPINVSILNQGANAETFKLEVSNDTTLIENRTVFLASSASKNESFTWNTEGMDPGNYNITARAILATDLDSSNDERTTTIELESLGGDVAVTNVVASENQTYQPWTINVTVTVLNNGTDPISFNVTAYYENVTAAYEIGTQNVPDLAGGAEMNVTFSWNLTLTGVALGLYDVKANATLLPLDFPDTYLDNNEFVVYNATKVKMPGDVDGSAKVDWKDLREVCLCYGSSPPPPPYNKQCDFDGSDKIDWKDLRALCLNYGKSTPAYPPDP